MKSFFQFQEDLSRHVIPLDKTAQQNLTKARKGQIGPGSRPVPDTKFTLEPVNIKLK